MKTATASKTVVGVFNHLDDAQNAVRELENAGFSHDDVSIVANRNVQGTNVSATNPPVGGSSEVAADAGIGAAIGGVGGLLIGFAALAVPGVGPVLAIGPIVAALSGAGIGAVAGGMIGALTESGVPEEEARHYAEGLRRGDVLVTIRTNDAARAEDARDILDRAGAIDVEGRVSGWRDRGWSGHDPGAEPLSQDEIRREREYYAAFEQQGDEWEREEMVQEDVVQDQSGLVPGGGTLPRTAWPHTEGHDVSESLARASTPSVTTPPRTDKAAPAEPADTLDTALRDTASMVGDTSRPLPSDVDSPSNYSDAIENNVRRPDPAVVHAERGFERAMDSASRSAKRLGSRIYDRDDPKR